MDDAKLCLSIVEVSDRTGLSVSTIRKLTRCGGDTAYQGWSPYPVFTHRNQRLACAEYHLPHCS